MIAVSNISKSFKKKVLADISMNVREGKLTGIAGKNGSGKSTLLKIMTSLLKPDSGTVLYDDIDIFNNPKILKKLLGYVPQENSLFDNLSVKDNFKFFSRLNGLDNFDPVDKDILSKKVKDLSGGMRKRLNIEISVLNDPKYLVLDEPTASLDIYNKNLTFDLMREFCANNKGVVFSSHDLRELYMSDEIYIIDNGVVFFEGKPSSLGSFAEFSDEVYKIISRME